MLYNSGAKESFTPSLKLDGDNIASYVVSSQDEKILAFAKANMEIEGFEISPELEEEGQKILTGEIDVEDFVRDTIAFYTKK